MCFHFLKLYQYHTWTSVRLVAPGKEGRDVIVMELFMPVCSDHAGHMRHKVPKSSPLYREGVTIGDFARVLSIFRTSHTDIAILSE